MAAMAPRYKLAIFDFDGTLADSAAWFQEVFNEVAQRYRFRTVLEHEFDELRGKDTRALLAHLRVATWKLPFIARHMRRLVARDAHRITLFPGAADLIDQLANHGVTLAIVSSNAEANVRTILGPLTAPRVRFFECGAGLFGKRSKFQRVLKQSGIPATQAIAIGDEVRDIEAAFAAGIAAGAVAWGYATRELLQAHKPTALFNDVGDIACLVAADGTLARPST